MGAGVGYIATGMRKSRWHRGREVGYIATDTRKSRCPRDREGDKLVALAQE